LLEYIVLPLDAGNRLVHVGQDGALEKVLRATFSYQTPKNVLVECLGNRFALFLRVRDARECVKELVLSIKQFDMDAQLHKKGHDLLWLVLSHQSVVNEVRLKPVTQSLVAEHGDG